MLADHDRRRGEIGEPACRRLRSELSARLVELSEREPPSA
jgi:hypothetical protein